ncbi:MAG: cadherin-like beta sandwich domain-containing protein, partial [Candidatus Porifericomitaceae bacterium WSBS_2022_MAG_OTU9]
MPLIRNKTSHLLAGLILALPGWMGWYDGADARGLSAPSVFASDITAREPGHPVLGIDHSFPTVSGNRSAVALFGNLGAGVPGSYGGHGTGSGLPDIHGGGRGLVVDTQEIGLATELRQKMQHKMEGLASPEGVARVAQSMQGQGRDTRDAVADLGAELAQAAIDSSLQRVEEELCCNGIVRGLNLSWSPGYGGRASLLQVDAVFVTLDDERAAVMTQLGLQSRDEETAGNIGVAMRTRITPDLLLGVNVFYDYLSEPRLDRWSVGAEVRHRWGTVSGNYYTAITDPRRSGNEELYSPDGWDLELSGQVPGAPWFGYAARYYKWDRLGGEDLSGAEYTLAMKPMSMLTLKAKYDVPESGNDDLGFEAEIRYNFDQTLAKQLSYQGVVPAEDVWRQRFERVRREYEQRVQRRQVGPGDALTQVACAAGTSGTVCMRINNVPQNAAAVVVRLVSGITTGAVAAVGFNSLLRIVPDSCTRTQVVATAGCRLQAPMVGDVLTIMGLAPGASFTFELSYVDSVDMALARQTVNVVAEGMLTQLGVVASASRLDETTGGTGTVTLTITATPGQELAAAFTLTGGTAGTNYSLTLADGTAVTSPASIPAPASEGAASTLQLILTALDDADTANENLLFTLTAPADGSYSISPTDVSVSVQINDDDDAASSDTTLSALALTPAVALSPGFNQAVRSYTATVPSNVASVEVAATAADFRAMGVTALDGANNNVGLNAAIALAVGTTTTITVRVTAEDSSTGDYTIVLSRAAATTPVVSFAQASTMAAEDAGVQQLQINVSPGSHAGFTLRLRTSGTATLTDDYTVTGLGGSAPNYTLNIAANESTALVSVTPIDDNVDENDETVVFEVVSDSAYSLGTVPSATLTIGDNDTRGLAFSTTAVDVAEGANAFYMVRLQSQPIAPVTVSPSSPDTGAVTVGPALMFTTANWASNQQVTVAGVDDADSNNETVAVAHAVSGGDYGTVMAPSLTVRVDDNNDAVSNDASLSALVLQSQSGVELPISPTFLSATRSYSATGDVASDAASVTVVATATVPSASVAISLNGAAATNGMVNNLQPGANEISVLVTAEDTISTTTYTLTVVVLPEVNFAGSGSTVLTVAEDAGRLSVTVATNATTHGAITVSIMLAGSATLTEDYSIGGLSLDSGSTYTVTIAANQPGQAFTIDIMDDNDSEETESIILSVVDNDAYTVGATSTYTINITDNDTIGLVLTPARLDVNEGGSGSYTIALASRPTATVMVTPASGGAAIATVAAASGSFPLMFTTGNWQTRQTVNVAGTEDADAVNGLVTISHTVVGGDYDGLGAGSVIVRVADDEAAASNDASLTSLTVAQAADSTVVALTPAFSAAVTSYTATVPFASDSINIVAETNVPSANFVVSLNAVPATSGAGDALVVSSLAAGVGNAVMIVVTAQDGSSQTYTVTVTRTAASTDNNLQGLTLSSGTLSPLFSASQREYAASVEATADSITVTATAMASSASIAMEVDGSQLTVTNGVSGAILLVANVPRRITVLVTAESGVQVDYLVTATRQLATALPTISFASTGDTVGEADTARR